MSKSIFITGSDTGVGKTIISTSIILTLLKMGIKTGYFKPIETGCVRKKGNLIPHDGQFIKKICNIQESLDTIVPVRYNYSLSPLVASEIERKKPDLIHIKSIFKKLSKIYDFMVVEGAGGLAVPIIQKKSSIYFMIDLIKDLNLDLIIVTKTQLGTINHTLLTIDYALKNKIKILGLIINSSTNPKRNLAETTNPEILKRLSPVPVLGVMPFIKSITQESLKTAALNYIDFSIWGI